MIYKRSFLKWAGSKYQLLSDILAALPKGKRLLEPFVGSGVVFLNAEYPSYSVNDINTDLISVYQNLKKYGETFIEDVKYYFTEKNNHKDSYVTLRKQFNQSTDRYERAALFIYLNRHCFNGLCRYNSRGEFNVPFGRYKTVTFPENTLKIIKNKLRCTTIHCKPYNDFFALAKPGDVIYCDPPYVTNHESAAFKYFGAEFNFDDQQRLVVLATQKAKLGITTIISNNATTETMQLYQASRCLKEVTVFRSMNCQVDQRRRVSELMAIY